MSDATMERCEVKINIQMGPSGDNEVIVNGARVNRVRALKFEAGANGLPRLTLVLLPTKVEVNCLDTYYDSRYAMLTDTVVLPLNP